MNYTPRYTYWLYKAGLQINELPVELAALIKQYETSFTIWLEAEDKEQLDYVKIVEQADAFISASIYTLFEPQITRQTESDTLKDLMSKAADLDF